MWFVGLGNCIVFGFGGFVDDEVGIGLDWGGYCDCVFVVYL